MTVLIAPSILNADFSHLADEVAAVAGADWLHVDVMDNHFVPNLTIGLPVVESIRKATELPLDCHLMIENPDRWAVAYAEAGAYNVTVHAEAVADPVAMAANLRAAGARAGLTLKPGTPIEDWLDVLKHFDTLLVMTVEPGFGGQSFMADMMAKVRTARRLVDTGAAVRGGRGGRRHRCGHHRDRRGGGRRLLRRRVRGVLGRRSRPLAVARLRAAAERAAAARYGAPVRRRADGELWTGRRGTVARTAGQGPGRGTGCSPALSRSVDGSSTCTWTAQRRQRRRGSARLTVRGPKVTSDVGHGDSIAVSGVCLTVVDRDGDSFTVDVMAETLRRIHRRSAERGRRGQPGTVGHPDDPVGRPHRAGSRGRHRHRRAAHRAPGLRRDPDRASAPTWPGTWRRKGSVAVDGISLTVIDVVDLTGDGVDGVESGVEFFDRHHSGDPHGHHPR